MLKYSLGIDISKKDFSACLSVTQAFQPVKVVRSTTFLNTKDGFEKLEKWFHQTTVKTPDCILHIVMEATGVYYENCAMYLYKKGYNVHIVLPNKSKKYLEAIGLKSKTDKSDAKGLSRMCAEQQLELWQPLGSYYYELRALTRHYQGIQESITAIGNQLEAALHGMYQNKEVVKSLKRIKVMLENQLQKAKETISDHLKKEKEVASKVENITRIKGIAELSVAVIIAETNGFLLFKNAKQLVSYAGYDVIENQSGSRVGKTRISKKGNSKIRRALHMPALNVVRYNEPVFSKFYLRNLERHGIKMKSYVAVQKKLLTTIYYLWKENKSFTSDYEQCYNQRKEAGVFL